MAPLKLLGQVTFRPLSFMFHLQGCQNCRIITFSYNFLNIPKYVPPKNYFHSHVQHINIHNYCITNVSLSFCFLQLKRTFSRSTATCKSEIDNEDKLINEDDLFSSDAIDEKLFEEFSRELLPVVGMHSVFVIQPYIKWGVKKKRNTTPELQLQEAIALVESLHGWKVLDKTSIGLTSARKKTFFGSGNFQELVKIIRKNERITAVFISTKMLLGIQHRELQNAFRVPVFDRYTLIIHLFRQHAISREAKLQVAMAEIPYMRSQIRTIGDAGLDKRIGDGATTLEIRRQVLEKREIKIKHELEKLRNHRQLLRSKRQKLEYPVVAVVGYTNAGKTSLIKALTGDERMRPKNQLFATLDISTHMGLLPCRLKVLYVDTIGFISDIPTNLLESFVATLEDALIADVIIHVTDVSHPDRIAQIGNVNNTLKSLHVESDILQNIIVVGNKIDLVDGDLPEGDDFGIPVSAIAPFGLTALKKRIEETILKETERTALTIRVPMGGQEASWLYKEATVTDTEADPENCQFLLMHVIITNAQLSKFHHYFIRNNHKYTRKT